MLRLSATVSRARSGITGRCYTMTPEGEVVRVTPEELREKARVVREAACVMRTGHSSLEEFVLGGPERAEQIASLLEAVAELPQPAFEIGVALLPEWTGSAEELVRTALALTKGEADQGGAAEPR